MTSHIKQQVFTNHTHQVDTSITHVVFRVVFTETGTHVAVDRVQTLCNSTGTVDVRFFSDDDLLVLTPVARFESSTRTTQAGTSDQDIYIIFYNSLRH